MLRRYTLADRTTCVAILESNTPRFFAHRDREDFLSFLDAPAGIYSVLEDNNSAIIGCGGIATRNKGQEGILTWGMIHADRHRQGWGKLLALTRLRQLSGIPSVQKVTINTSNETVGFYSTLDFRVTNYRPNYYSEGLHRYDMELLIDDDIRRRLREINRVL